MKKFLGLFLVIFLSVVVTSCGKTERSAELHRKKISASLIPVPTKTAWKGRSFPGTVEAKNRVELSSRMAAYVTAVKVNEGDHVEKGQLLVSIDDRSLKEKINALEATLTQIGKQKKALMARVSYARAQFRRYSALLKEQAATREEFERIKSEYNALLKQTEAVSAREKSVRAQIKDIEASLSYANILAPTSGTVTQRFVDPGTFVNMGQPLLSMEAPKKGFWFKARVDESLYDSAGQIPGVVVSIPSIAIDFFTRSILVVPDIDSSTHTFLVKVDLSKTNLSEKSKSRFRDGLYGRLVWLTDARKIIVIPVKAIVTRGEIKGVYVVDEGNVVHFRVIKQGSFFSQINIDGKEIFVPVDLDIRENSPVSVESLWVEVLSGLEKGEKIVISNLDQVSEGNIVK